MEGRRRLSPERGTLGTMHQQQQGSRVRGAPGMGSRKVQVVYYLCRNGQLEHPHFMEVCHLPNQHLRLKDVIDRLTVLRGRGMPSLFSWSCKRSYKNGYVWNDLSENDAIYPADGAEYVLKGSEFIHGSSVSERLQHLQVSPRLPRPVQTSSNATQYVDLEEEEHEIEDYDKPGNHTGGARTPNFRRSRGVSTDELGGDHTTKQHTELPLGDDSSPPSSSSSDPAAESGQSRNSLLLQLISCGSVTVKGAGVGPGMHVSCAGGSARRSGGLRRASVSRLGACRGEEEEMRCMSENPRFGNPQAEEKEYFSGSIVEAIAESGRAAPEPVLKKSSSYNEERSNNQLGIEEERVEGGEGGRGVKGKCIPGRKRTSTKK